MEQMLVSKLSRTLFLRSRVLDSSFADLGALLTSIKNADMSTRAEEIVLQDATRPMSSAMVVMLCRRVKKNDGKLIQCE